MAALTKYPEPLVFGLDIGTRSIVGTVGYRDVHGFHVVAQSIRYHETRAMMDGQIHDIGKVSSTIREVKKELEEAIGRRLTEVCIAAAGRVLKTAVGKGEYAFEENTVVTDEYIHSLDLIGVEKAHEQILEENDTDIKFYCVGYTVIKYYLNDYEITNLEGHKANKIGADVLATFLPEEVVDGLYASVEMADLEVANLTLEPIAAINVAIPENYRLLNIALVDVGAGTSDICVTKDGSIVGYGMIPAAGDEMTEALIKKYLVDFKTAEKIKMAGPRKKTISFKDIMGISQKITQDDMLHTIESPMKAITKSIAEKIVELNAGKPVSAVFVVGGGGKITGFTNLLAKELGLPEERVALRGEEVLGDVEFLVEGIKKDPLLVTPIGICLNFYDQKNNFIFVRVNKERVKLYNNDKLTIFDAVVQFGISNERIFPRRGADLTYQVNGKSRMVRGHQGEAAVIKLNGKETGINTAIEANDEIEIAESTIGESASLLLSQIPECHNSFRVQVNESYVDCPMIATVNGTMVTEYYEVLDGDDIQILNYYTVQQLLTLLDVTPDTKIYVNKEEADMDSKVYENFHVTWSEIATYQELKEEQDLTEDKESAFGKQQEEDRVKQEENPDKKHGNRAITVIVNGKPVTITGKETYVFVDIFEMIDFDRTTAQGTELVTTKNGAKSEYLDTINDGDVIEVYWRE